MQLRQWVFWTKLFVDSGVVNFLVTWFQSQIFFRTQNSKILKKYLGHSVRQTSSVCFDLEQRVFFENLVIFLIFVWIETLICGSCVQNDGETTAAKMAYILSDISDRIIRACNMLDATQAATHDILCDISYDMIWHTGLIHRLDSYRIFDLVLSDDGVCIICYLW